MRPDWRCTSFWLLVAARVALAARVDDEPSSDEPTDVDTDAALDFTGVGAAAAEKPVLADRLAADDFDTLPMYDKRLPSSDGKPLSRTQEKMTFEDGLKAGPEAMDMIKAECADKIRATKTEAAFQVKHHEEEAERATREAAKKQAAATKEVDDIKKEAEDQVEHARQLDASRLKRIQEAADKEAHDASQAQREAMAAKVQQKEELTKAKAMSELEVNKAAIAAAAVTHKVMRLASKEVQDAKRQNYEALNKAKTAAEQEVSQAEHSAMKAHSEVVDTKEEAAKEIKAVKDAALAEVDDIKKGASCEIKKAKAENEREVGRVKQEAAEELSRQRHKSETSLHEVHTHFKDEVKEERDYSVKRVASVQKAYHEKVRELCDERDKIRRVQVKATHAVADADAQAVEATKRAADRFMTEQDRNREEMVRVRHEADNAIRQAKLTSLSEIKKAEMQAQRRAAHEVSFAEEKASKEVALAHDYADEARASARISVERADREIKATKSHAEDQEAAMRKDVRRETLEAKKEVLHAEHLAEHAQLEAAQARRNEQAAKKEAKEDMQREREDFDRKLKHYQTMMDLKKQGDVQAVQSTADDRILEADMRARHTIREARSANDAGLVKAREDVIKKAELALGDAKRVHEEEVESHLRSADEELSAADRIRVQANERAATARLHARQTVRAVEDHYKSKEERLGKRLADTDKSYSDLQQRAADQLFREREKSEKDLAHHKELAKLEQERRLAAQAPR
eukprot:TRINITY_DN102050_c0_g1_i1.p1 TRINITY_DN102050_c0_g1~~TRINITY_DN102050_c0_g1_i1.p1  ORF type:complete len:747 (-),score=272.96 TRINITY_DN102050_c0_g1_i1:123-2363(-)